MANLYDPAITADPVQALSDLQTLNASISPEADYQDNARAMNWLRWRRMTWSSVRRRGIQLIR